VKTFYSAKYTVDLPDGHRFPMEKYAQIRAALPERAGLPESWVRESPEITRDEVVTIHDERYFDDFVTGRLDRRHQRKIGFPWSDALVGRILTTVGGTLAAARCALEEGIGSNLAGGTHHAMYDAGEGFCVFNDIAIAASVLLEQGAVDRIAVLDLDVHQGNGTAQLVGDRSDVLLISVHGEKNYPFQKSESDLDIGIVDGTGDATFLRVVDSVLPTLERFDPDLVLYQAGVDVLATDSLGRLGLTFDGVEARDRRVFETLRRMGAPLALVLGGGYADPIDDTVEGHVRTYRALNGVYELW
jgi:acetoin utilization deacetylase AcuC-like enzyme